MRNPSDPPPVPAGVVSLPLNVTKPDQIADAVNFIEQQGNGLSALINNAGVHDAGPLELIDMERARNVFEVNFWGTINMTRAVLPLLRNQRRGHIVSISSLSGLAALAGDSIYAASKHALEAAMESLSHEIAPWNIKVNTVQPGAFQSGLTQAKASADSASLYQHLKSGGKAQKDALPGPDDIAREIATLLNNPSRELQVPVGNQAKLVACKLRSFDQKKRRSFLREASGIPDT